MRFISSSSLPSSAHSMCLRSRSPAVPVQSMLDLHRQIFSPGLEYERTLLDRRIEATDRQIDRLVYELYGPTEEEIGLVVAK